MLYNTLMEKLHPNVMAKITVEIQEKSNYFTLPGKFSLWAFSFLRGILSQDILIERCSWSRKCLTNSWIEQVQTVLFDRKKSLNIQTNGPNMQLLVLFGCQVTAVRSQAHSLYNSCNVFHP